MFYADTKTKQSTKTSSFCWCDKLVTKKHILLVTHPRNVTHKREREFHGPLFQKKTACGGSNSYVRKQKTSVPQATKKRLAAALPDQVLCILNNEWFFMCFQTIGGRSVHKLFLPCIHSRKHHTTLFLPSQRVSHVSLRSLRSVLPTPVLAPVHFSRYTAEPAKQIHDHVETGHDSDRISTDVLQFERII